MEVTRSGYYRYLQSQKHSEKAYDTRLIVELKVLHQQTRKSYGSRRMAKALTMQGNKIGRHKTRRLMRQNGIECKQRRRYAVTTNSKHGLTVAENILNRQFDVEDPNQKWVSDITYLWTLEGWLYIAAVVDLFSRKIIGWAIADHMRAELIESALNMAMLLRRPQKGLLHHSDQGIQYASQQYQAALMNAGVIVSMSRKGNCWDNAVMERVFGSLKTERTDGQCYATRDAAKADVIDYIENFYNNKRLHSTLNYLSPIQYEKLYENNNNKASSLAK